MVKIHRRTLVQGALLSPLASLPVAAQAADATPLPDFFRHSSLSEAQLSPSGKHLAGLRDNAKGRANIVVVDLATRKATIITNFDDGDVSDLLWVNDNRLLFEITDRQRGGGDQVGSGLFAIDRDAKNFLQLAERSFATEGRKMLPAGTSFHSRLKENGKLTAEVRVTVGTRHGQGRASSNLYRLNTETGRFSLLSLGGPANTNGWWVDRNGVPRVAMSYVDEVTSLHVRDSADAPWRVIHTVRDEDGEKAIQPLGFNGLDKLYVSARPGTDTAGIYVLDIKSGQLDPNPVAAIKGFDVEGPLYFDAEEEDKLAGIGYEAARRGVYWIDEHRAAIQAQVDKLLPDTVNSLQFRGTSAAPVVMAFSYSDREPGRYYLFDAKTQQMQGLGATRPWIKAAEMRPTSFFRYAARDGMQIPAQLTLPAGEGKFPLVVLHYGGPWVRPISWRWDPVVQFLASRGYAVFMPAPRASTGFGYQLFKSGWKQWGLAMQDDVTDGVKHLIAQGQIDPKRVCIAGASYGGYLTMMGLVKEPELYRCGINWVGVTDPSFMFTVTWTDFNRFGGPDTGLRRLIGDPQKDAQQFKDTSPLLRAAEIKQPVLMGYGAQDQRVPLINGEKMLAALKPHNPKVEWVTYSDEGHGWRTEANNVDFWSRVERFLAANLK